MKKEARTEAQTLFLRSGGKASNTEIARNLGVHPLTVGRWKRQDIWIEKLEQSRPKPTKKKETPVVRKKSKQEEALKHYTESGGLISNKALATRVGVSPATISSWKGTGNWKDQVETPSVSAPAPIERVEETGLPYPEEEIQTLEEIEIDLEALTYPDHITVLNRRLDELLAREYLCPMDLKTAAEVKEAVLRAVGAYMEVLEKASED